MLVNEGRIQEDNNDALIKSIEETQKQIIKELCTESTERENIESGFINLIEQTCERIERNLNFV